MTQPSAWFWHRTLAVDLSVALAVAVVDLLTQWEPGATDRIVGQGPVPSGLVLQLAGLEAVALTFRRRLPQLAFGLVWAQALVAHVLLPGYRPTLGLLLVLGTLAMRTTLPRAALAFLAVSVVSPFAVLDEVRSREPDERASTWLAGLALFTVANGSAWAFGRWAGQSRRHLVDLERRRLAAASEAEAAERTRIAHELHDIVAHAVTLIVVQAAVARRANGVDVAAARALAEIETTGKQAMGELRRMLRVLDDASPSARGHRGPGDVGLEGVPGLVARMAATGVDVTVSHWGDAAQLDASVGVAAYRVVQEGLTNVVKHAGPGAQARVGFDWHDRRLLVTVLDDGAGGRQSRAPAGLSLGLGLVGLRERVRAVGGTFDAHPLGEGGFRLAATFPTAAEATTEERLAREALQQAAGVTSRLAGPA